VLLLPAEIRRDKSGHGEISWRNQAFALKIPDNERDFATVIKPKLRNEQQRLRVPDVVVAAIVPRKSAFLVRPETLHQRE
jgi:hypothetical protein